MAGSIVPLPVMLDEEDRKIFEALQPPKTIVVRYGYQRKIAELPYSGDATPGCGSKLVAVTPRGTEVVEMLTTTCGNSGCGKSVSRTEMRDYIDKSGGKQFPFTNQGRVLRVATVEDMNENAKLENRRADLVRLCKSLINEFKLEMKLVEVESIFGDEQIAFYFLSESRIDFRELVKRLASELHTRIEMVHVTDREESRLVADYEKCGQHCCCRQFLKVLKPVSMRAAKVQKNTLDPQKISGRCGRLMCCLRYEDETYADLKKQLPHRKSLVDTIDGIGIVLSTQILTQLALVKIGAQPPAAYPVEDLRVLDNDEVKAWREEYGDPVEAAKNTGRPPRNDNQQRKGGPRGKDKAGPRNDRGGAGNSGDDRSNTKPRRPKPGKPLTDSEIESKEGASSASIKPVGNGNDANVSSVNASGASEANADGDQPKKKRRRRRRKRKGGQGGGSGDGGQGPTPPSGD